MRIWTRRHAPSLAIVLGLLVVAAIVLGTGSARYPSFSDDEGTYAAQAWAVRTQGALAHYTFWYDHPPLGWLQLALATVVAQPLLGTTPAVELARALMLVPAIVSGGLVFLLARRLRMRRPFAAAALALFTLSPLAVTSLRQVYLDNLALPWVLGAFVLAASPGRRLWAFAASGLCFVAAILTKETMLLLLPALVVQVVAELDRRTRAFCLTAFFTTLALLALTYPLYALLKGELVPGPGHVSLLDAVRFQLYTRPSNGSIFDPSSGSRALLDSWLNTDPWLLGLGVVLAPLTLAVRRLRGLAVAVLVMVLSAARGGYLPQPFVIAMLPFCALVIAGALDAAWRSRPLLRAPPWLRYAAAAGVLALAVAVAPGWRRADAYAMRADQTHPALAAERWIERNVDPRARIMVDDTFYVDLVRAGFAQRYGAVWFYKLDFTTNLDPSIVRELPQGWRAFDYVVSSEVIRSALAQSPGSFAPVRRALAHSAVVARFGTGANRVEVRRLTGDGVGSGRVPKERRP